MISGKTVELLTQAHANIKQGKKAGTFTIPELPKVSRSEYEEFAEVLTRLRGKWITSGKRHEFPYDPSEAIAAVIETRQMPDKNPLAYFPTPSKVASCLIEEIGDNFCRGAQKAVRLLEPSAGSGALVKLAAERFHPTEIVAVELDPLNVALLRTIQLPVSSGVRYMREIGIDYPDVKLTIVQDDFLNYQATDGLFNVIIMNPPFAVDGDRDAWHTHLLHAWSLVYSVTDSWCLGCIVPSGSWLKSERSKWVEFRLELERAGATIYSNGANAFAESGTSIETLSIVIAGGLTAERSADYAWLIMINTFEIDTELRALSKDPSANVRDTIETIMRKLWWSDSDRGGWLLNSPTIELVVKEFEDWKREDHG